MSETSDEQTLAQFAATLASLRGEESLAARLCEASRRVLDADGAAVTLDYTGPGRLVLHVNDELSAELDDSQDVVGEGPGFDATTTSEVVVGQFGDGSEQRWPLLQERLALIDFTGSVTAIPLHAEVAVIGVLTVHRHDLEPRDDLQTARFLGAAVGTALVQHPQIETPEHVLGDAWSTRSQVHQATGMIVAQIRVAPEDALALLRGHAFARNLSLNDVASEIVSRRINFRNFTIKGD